MMPACEDIKGKTMLKWKKYKPRDIIFFDIFISFILFSFLLINNILLSICFVFTNSKLTQFPSYIFLGNIVIVFVLFSTIHLIDEFTKMDIIEKYRLTFIFGMCIAFIGSIPVIGIIFLIIGYYKAIKCLLDRKHINENSEYVIVPGSLHAMLNRDTPPFKPTIPHSLALIQNVVRKHRHPYELTPLKFNFYYRLFIPNKSKKEVVIDYYIRKETLISIAFDNSKYNELKDRILAELNAKINS